MAADDLNGDGRAEIITGAGAGGGPHVKVFDGKDLSVLHSFFAYESGYSGGVRVAAGDVTGDGRADIVTGTGGGYSTVKVFDGRDRSLVHQLQPYPGFGGGVFVASG